MVNENIPLPDPTTLTTDALDKAVAALKEIIKDKVDARHSEQVAQTKLVEAQLTALSDVTTERFNSVDTQFTLVERQRVELKGDTKAAVDAALIAQKEAVKEQTIASEKAIAKSETSTQEYAKQSNQTFQTSIDALTKNINDLKERVVTIESKKEGGKEQTSAIYALVGFIISLLVLGSILAAAGFFNR
jgi:hypothetical protein